MVLKCIGHLENIIIYASSFCFLSKPILLVSVLNHIFSYYKSTNNTFFFLKYTSVSEETTLDYDSSTEQTDESTTELTTDSTIPTTTVTTTTSADFISCDFETDWCGYTNNEFFKRYSGKSPSFSSGPSADKTTGIDISPSIIV